MFPGSWTYRRIAGVAFFSILIGYSLTTIHELGHLIVGLCAGFRCQSVFLGPLHFDSRFRIALNPDRRSWWHGGVALFPGKLDDLCARAIPMVFAGPAANLLTGCAMLLLPFAKGFYSGLFIVASIGAGLIELLLPLHGTTFVFDGRRLWMLLRDRARGERWLALLRLAADTRNGVLPESLSADLIAKATAIRDHSTDTVVAHAFAYSAAFHKHRDAEAGQALEVCLQYAPDGGLAMREGLISDAAVFQARRRQRPDLAEQWLAALPVPTQFPWLRPRAEAAILEAQADVAGALSKLDECEMAIQRVSNLPLRAMLLCLLQRWKSELTSKRSSAL
jgi:hypothetical protein